MLTHPRFAGVFEVVIPILIASALVLVVFQPRISAWVTARREGDPREGGPLLRAGIGVTGLYGGYFGAAQGVGLFALLGTALPEDLKALNGLRNLLAGTANGTASVIFLAFADVRLLPALLLAAGSTAGGLLGAVVGKRLPEPVLRGLVVVVGIAAILRVVL